MSDEKRRTAPSQRPLDTHLPRSVTTRDDAAQLWWALSVANISFHIDDDPFDWVNTNGAPFLSRAQGTRIARLMQQAATIPESEELALRALRLLIYLGPEVFQRLSPRDMGAFASCSSLSQARSLVRRYAGRPGRHGRHHRPTKR